MSIKNGYKNFPSTQLATSLLLIITTIQWAIMSNNCFLNISIKQIVECEKNCFCHCVNKLLQVCNTGN